MEEDKPRPRREARTWQSRKSANTRYRLLEAALDVLVERGYANTSISRIAEVAKVSRGAVQFHFPTKQSAMEAVIGHIFQRRLDTYRAEMAKVPPQTDILEHALRVYWRQVTRAEFIAQQELELAARTDRQLASALHAAYREFVRQSRLPFSGQLSPVAGGGAQVRNRGQPGPVPDRGHGQRLHRRLFGRCGHRRFAGRAAGHDRAAA